MQSLWNSVICGSLDKAQGYFFNKQLYTMVHSHLMLKLVLNENLGGILGGTQWVKMSFSLMLSEC